MFCNPAPVGSRVYLIKIILLYYVCGLLQFVLWTREFVESECEEAQVSEDVFGATSIHRLSRPLVLFTLIENACV